MATLSVVGLHNKIVDDEKGIEEDAVDDNKVEEDLIPIYIRCGRIMILRIANHNKSLSMVIKHQSCKRHFYETTHNCCANTLLINSSFFFYHANTKWTSQKDIASKGFNFDILFAYILYYAWHARIPYATPILNFIHYEYNSRVCR